jgi:hypothetical protein
MNIDSLAESIRSLSDEDRKLLTEKLNAAAKPRSANVSDVDAVLRSVPGMSQHSRAAVVDILARSDIVSGDIDRMEAAAHGCVTIDSLNARAESRPLVKQILGMLAREFKFFPDTAKPISVTALNEALSKSSNLDARFAVRTQMARMGLIT